MIADVAALFLTHPSNTRQLIDLALAHFADGMETSGQIQ